MGSWKSLSKLGNLEYKVIPEVIVSWTMQGIQHLGNNNLHILLSRHFEQQIQSLFL